MCPLHNPSKLGIQLSKLLLVSFSILLLNFSANAQISYGGKPASFITHTKNLKEISYSPKIPFGLTKNESISKQCTAYEFGKLLPFERSLRDADFGNLTVDANGNSIWTASITSENALALGLYFSNFYLPKGAKLFVYSPDKEQIIGSFTDLNNSESAMFATELILGDKLVIEYNEPAAVAGLGHFTIDEVLHAFRGVSDLKTSNGFGGSGSCEVNVKCPEGTLMEKQTNSVVRLLIKEGTSAYWCTGSIVNNVNNNRTPYLLTADHCAGTVSALDLNQLLVYFNYQSATCTNPVTEPTRYTMTGATEIAASSNAGILGSDFYLALLNQNIPDTYNAYFMGWDRTGDISNNGVSIHHPAGDIKKISTYTKALVSTTYSSGGLTGSVNGFWEVVWSATVSGNGVTEGGSSGSPIYSQDGFLIGTLTGGWSSCSSLTSPDYYGKFNYHWDKNGTTTTTQLKPWLDPNNTGALFLSGIPVGFDESIAPKIENFFILFPNPSNGQIVLRFNELNFGKTITVNVFNMLGQLVYHSNPTVYYQYDLNLAELNRGVYFIEVNKDSQRQSQKISIQ